LYLSDTLSKEDKAYTELMCDNMYYTEQYYNKRFHVMDILQKKGHPITICDEKEKSVGRPGKSYKETRKDDCLTFHTSCDNSVMNTLFRLGVKDAGTMKKYQQLIDCQDDKALQLNYNRRLEWLGLEEDFHWGKASGELSKEKAEAEADFVASVLSHTKTFKAFVCFHWFNSFQTSEALESENQKRSDFVAELEASDMKKLKYIRDVASALGVRDVFKFDPLGELKGKRLNDPFELKELKCLLKAFRFSAKIKCEKRGDVVKLFGNMLYTVFGDLMKTERGKVGGKDHRVKTFVSGKVGLCKKFSDYNCVKI
jgi:hypothetical protein